MNDPATGIAAALARAPRILILGAGKAGSAMAAAVEAVLPQYLDRMEGLVNVPAESVMPLRKIRLHAARPAGSNQPTADGVVGAQEMLRLAETAGPEDVALCLISGGGSALLPAPAAGVTLADKQDVTLRLHACGAAIQHMNAVRKHLSAIKGGRLAQAFRGKALHSLIISDVIGDPLDVIASGPTAADPTTFADALAVLDRFGLRANVPAAIVQRLEQGARGLIPETPKTLPAHVLNHVLGNNQTACAAARAKAQELGYQVLSLGQDIQGEAQTAARLAADRVREVKNHGGGRVCLIGGGETTVALTPGHGKGGRNQEWVLAALLALGPRDLSNVVLLSGGTDGEDGPTDAAGASADAETLASAARLGLDPADFLARHDAYAFFQAAGGLLITGLTNTNVMDVQVVIVQMSSKD